MYCLVRFLEDKVWHVCKNSAVRGEFAKWLDGYRYQAEVIARSHKHGILKDICTNLSNGVPVVLLQRIDTISCKKKLFNELNEQTDGIGLEVEDTFFYDNVKEKFNILEIIHEKEKNEKMSPRIKIISDITLKDSEKESSEMEKSHDYLHVPAEVLENNKKVHLTNVPDPFETDLTDVSDPFETDGDSSYVPSEEISDDAFQDDTGINSSLIPKYTDDLPIPGEDELFHQSFIDRKGSLTPINTNDLPVPAKEELFHESFLCSKGSLTPKITNDLPVQAKEELFHHSFLGKKGSLTPNSTNDLPVRAEDELFYQSFLCRKGSLTPKITNDLPIQAKEELFHQSFLGKKCSLTPNSTNDLPVQPEDELFYQSVLDRNASLTNDSWVGNGDVDKQNIDVLMQGSADSHKKKTKQHCCFICMKLVTKLPKHLELHQDNYEVLKALSLPKGSTERRKFLYELQKKGDFEYNSHHESLPISVRKGETKNLMPCPYCKGYYSKKNLRNHIRLVCRTQKKNLNSIVLSRALQPRILNIANDLLKYQVIPKLRDDDISKIIRHDRLLIICGNMWCTKYSSSSHHQKMIRYRLRHLAKILQTLKQHTNRVTDFFSIFHPRNFDDVATTIQEIAGLNSRRGEYKAPSSATNSCTLLLQAAEMCKFEAIKAEDEEREKNIDKFIFLLEKSMNPLITKMAIENRTQRQRQKVVTLPKTEDVQKIFVLICNTIKDCLNQLTNGFDEENWTSLAKNLLVAIMIFNRKRPGEIERAHLLDYKNCQIIDDESQSSLGGQEQALAKVFGRFTIRGKLNRTVPVVVSELMRCGIDTLLKFRRDAGIPEDNKYIFACKCNSGETDATFSAHLALKEIKNKISDSKHITSTNLRKHLATVSNKLNLNDQKVNTVASFLGHDTSIHKQIYVQRPIISDVVGVTPILNEAVGVTNNEAHIFENYGTLNLSTVFEQSFESEGAPKYKRKAESDEVEEGGLCKSRKKFMFRRPPRRTWTTPEKEVMRRIFRDDIANKEVPTLPQCTQVMMEHKSLSNRTPKQLQLWVLSETRRADQAARGELHNKWTTPERKACREYFKSFYKTHKYPNKDDLERAIATIPELHDRTPQKLKSHLQHDLKYISRTSS